MPKHRAVKNHSFLIYIFISIFILIGVASFILSPLRPLFEEQVILPLNNEKSIVKIIDEVPQATSKIIIDFNGEDFDPTKFQLKGVNNRIIPFYKTTFGSSAQIKLQDIDHLLDLSLESYTWGDVNIVVTYANSNNQEIDQYTQVEHFEMNQILLWGFRGLSSLILLIVIILPGIFIFKKKKGGSNV